MAVSGEWLLKGGKPLRQGLPNPGAWCYRRAVLQTLLSNPFFFNLVTDHRPAACSKSCVPCALRNLADSYHRNPTQTHARLQQLDNSTRMQPGKGRPRWQSNNTYNQEDTHEYMLFLFNSLNATQCINIPALQGTFNIAHRASWTCEDCNATHTHDDPAGWSLSLPIYAAKQSLSLASCMNRYHGAARLTIRCDECKTNKPRQRSTAIRQLPEVLTIHLLRFTPGQYGMRKNTDKVNVPETFDIAPWCMPKSTRTRYQLNGIVYHSGGLDNGHYIARVRTPTGIELLDDARPPQRMQGWMDAAKNFTPYVLVFLRQSV
ncbi:hypothetical protein ANO11243_015940 [Dothideomycetidae sp. 11243]|nr:hypothetical protein ANO11243_015940 [fungal sp. No.11243]